MAGFGGTDVTEPARGAGNVGPTAGAGPAQQHGAERANAIPLQAVAEVVQRYDGRRGYIAEIMAEQRVPRKTAQRWVSLARREGLLPSMRQPRSCPRCRGTGLVTWGESSRGQR